MTQPAATTPPVSPASGAQRLQEIRAEQMLAVARGSPVVLCAGIPAALLLVLGIGLGNPNDAQVLGALVWFAVISTGLLVGVALARKITRKSGIAPEEILRSGRWISRNAGVCGVIWGSIAWWGLPTLVSEQESFVLVGVAMVMVGGSSAHAAYRPTVRAFTLCLTLTFLAGVLQLRDDYHLLYAAAFALLCFVTLISSQNQEQSLHQQIVFRLERDQLRRVSDAAREAAECEQRNSERAREEAVQARNRSDRERLAAEREREQAEVARREAEVAQQRSDQARQEAELASRAKTAFLTAACHDMRGSIHAFGAYLDLLDKHNHDPQLEEWLGLCRLSEGAVEDLLNSMLDMSRIEAGTIKPVLERTSMRRLLRMLDAQFRAAVPNKVTFEVEPIRAMVYTDVGLLRRILLNLTSNAIRYTERGRVGVRCSIQGPVLRCIVFDTGIGIAKEEQDKIYEPFYQVPQDNGGSPKGLGIGLTIVRQLCQLLGYKLWLRSVPGKGSVFAVDVPLATAAQIAAPRAQPPSKENWIKGKLILLIDNNRTELGATATLIREMHGGVIAVDSGQAALAKLHKDRPPDLVLADYGLDGETGLQVIARIADKLRKTHGPDFRIPALIITGDTSPNVLSAVRDQGFKILHKPASYSVLRQALNQALQDAQPHGARDQA